MNIIRSLAVVSGLVLSASAGAVTWGHDATSSTAFAVVSLTTQGGSIYCSTTTCSSSALSGQNVLTMKAYSTQTVSSGNPSEAGAWMTAKLASYNASGVVGIGITNMAGESPVDGAAPEQGIDNNGVDEILVIDFGSGGWDVSSFSLGYTCNATASGGCTAANVKTSAWLTNTLPNAFTGTEGSAIPNGTGAVALSFTNNDTQIGQRTVSGSNTGRYLIIAGDPTRNVDAFTFKGVSATRVPLPGSAPLLGLALLAMAWIYRRRPIPVRARG